MAAPRQWGLTAPISTHFPSEKEIQLNESLLTELKEQKTFESAEETEKRYGRQECGHMSCYH